jgi:hypothetical protein
MQSTTVEELKRWLGKTGQGDKWSICLKAAKIAASRRDDEQTTTPEPYTGI